MVCRLASKEIELAICFYPVPVPVPVPDDTWTEVKYMSLARQIARKDTLLIHVVSLSPDQATRSYTTHLSNVSLIPLDSVTA